MTHSTTTFPVTIRHVFDVEIWDFQEEGQVIGLCLVPLFSRTLTERQHTRVTRNRLTFTFFLFGLLHCFAQGIIQSFLFSIDSEYSSFLSQVVHAADVPPKNHTYLEGSSGNYRLRMCNYIPHFDYNCTDVFESHRDTRASNISFEDVCDLTIILHSFALTLFPINSQRDVANLCV